MTLAGSGTNVSPTSSSVGRCHIQGTYHVLARLRLHSVPQRAAKSELGQYVVVQPLCSFSASLRGLVAPNHSLLPCFNLHLQGSTDGVGTSATFYHPTACAIDAAGMLLVADKFKWVLSVNCLVYLYRASIRDGCCGRPNTACHLVLRCSAPALDGHCKAFLMICSN